MEIKKSPKANLEKYKLLFLAISLIISIGALVYAFQWQSSSEVVDMSNEDVIVEEEMLVTRQDEKIEPPEQPEEQKQQQTLDVIEILDDNADIEETEFDFEEFNEEEEVEIEEVEEEEDKIFIHVKNMPEFPGGITALRRWIGTHVNYPAVARENGIQGTVYLRFEVTKSGKVGRVEMQKGVDPLLDDEALKVIKKLPKFKPGEQNGRKVNVWYSIPVTFKLS